MKSSEELNALKEKVETLNKKLAELTEDELKQVSGGDIEITCDLIMQYIDAGNERMAAGYFKVSNHRFKRWFENSPERAEYLGRLKAVLQSLITFAA